MKDNFKQFWKKNAFKIIVFASVIIIIICYFINDNTDGTWAETYFYEPKEHREPPKASIVRQSKGEKKCREVLERIFKRPFHNKRPLFLFNNITGKPLEIDCCNEDLKLGVEYNGKQHYQYVAGLHKNYDAFRNQQYRDEKKQRLCDENNFRLITVPYTIEENNIEEFLIAELSKYGYLQNL